MIRKIICPVDFSPASRNAAEYAANFCRTIGASLELLHVEPLVSNELLLPVNRTEEMNARIADASQQLRGWCDELTKTYRISCSSEVDSGVITLEEAVARAAGKHSLIIVAESATGSVMRRLFGAAAIHIAREADAPVLVIPEGVTFHPIEKIAFAWDYPGSESLLPWLKEFSGALKCTTQLVHISAHDSDISQDVYNAFRDKMEELCGPETELSFRRVPDSDIRQSLDRLMQEKQADVLAIALQNGSLLKSFLSGGNSGDRFPAYPLLIFRTQPNDK